jgi:hypothetical protein
VRGVQVSAAQVPAGVRLRALLPLVGAAQVRLRAQGLRRQQHQQAHPGTSNLQRRASALPDRFSVLLCSKLTYDVARMICLSACWRWIRLCSSFSSPSHVYSVRPSSSAFIESFVASSASVWHQSFILRLRFLLSYAYSLSMRAAQADSYAALPNKSTLLCIHI